AADRHRARPQDARQAPRDRRARREARDRAREPARGARIMIDPPWRDRASAPIVLAAGVLAAVLALAARAAPASAGVPPWGNPVHHESPRPAPRAKRAPSARSRRLRSMPVPVPAAGTLASPEWARVPAAVLPENAPVEHASDGDWIGAQDLA